MNKRVVKIEETVESHSGNGLRKHVYQYFLNISHLRLRLLFGNIAECRLHLPQCMKICKYILFLNRDMSFRSSLSCGNTRFIFMILHINRTVIWIKTRQNTHVLKIFCSFFLAERKSSMAFHNDFSSCVGGYYR